MTSYAPFKNTVNTLDNQKSKSFLDNLSEKDKYMYLVTKPIYKFERLKLGNRLAPNYTEYGKYLYRNTITNQLIASYESPFTENNILKKDLFNGEDIGYNTDALIYYKNT
jgi:hypothetical protein